MLIRDWLTNVNGGGNSKEENELGLICKYKDFGALFLKMKKKEMRGAIKQYQWRKEKKQGIIHSQNRNFKIVDEMKK